MEKKRISLSVVLVLCVFLLFQSSTNSQQLVITKEAATAPQIQASDGLPLYFIENSGQLGEQVEYHLKMPGGNVLFAEDSICYQFISNASKNRPSRKPEHSEDSGAPKLVSVENLRVRFDGASDSVEMFGLDEHEARFNFYQGNEPGSWVEGARSFNKVKYKNLYPRIDLVVFKSKGLLKQEYRVRPGGAAADICIAYEGAQNLGVNEKGQLQIQTASRTLLEDTPISYQIIGGQKIFIDTEYMVEEGNRVRFKVGDYDGEHALVIDPSLIYSTFFGGSDEDYATGIAIDLHLDAYVVGMSYSSDFVTTTGAVSVQRAAPDVFISKLDSTGSQLLFSTIFGSTGVDDATGIAFSWDDESPVIVGSTNLSNFPTTPGAYDRSFNGVTDIFLAKFSSNGNLMYSTFFGGSNKEDKPEVALDGAGNLYITGNTESSNFPTTAGAIDDEFDVFAPEYMTSENNNLFVAKFSKKVNNLLYSTLFGGPGIHPGGISVDYAGNAFITGAWSFWRDGSSWVPTTPGAYSSDDGGGYGNAFVASIAPSGTQLNYCTYLGFIVGGFEDEVWTQGISVDGSGRAFVTGNAYIENIQNIYPGYVAGFNASGSDRLFLRKYSGEGWERATGRAIAVDGRGSVYVLLDTNISDLETSDDAFQQSKQGKSDLYITKLKASNGNVIYSTYMGGNDDDFGYGLVVDSFGATYVTGKTWSHDFPTTAGAYSTLYGGKADAFIARIRDSSPTGELYLNRTKLVFASPYQSTATFTKNFALQNKGKGVVNYDISTNQKWLTVKPTTGDVRNEQDSVNVSVTADKLKPGTHVGIVKVSSIDAFNSPQQLVVKLRVKGPTFRLKRKKYTLSAAEGSTTLISLENEIKNKGPGKLRYKFKAMNPWLSIKPKRGVSTGEWDDFTIAVDPTGLFVGIHQGIIEVISKDTVDSPIEIVITLNITSSQ